MRSFEQCLATEHNFALIELFKEIESYQGNRKGAQKGGDTSIFKAKAYREARTKVQRFEKPITRHNLSEVMKTGGSCYNKAMEYLTKGSVWCLEEWRKDPRKLAVRELSKIFGVGDTKAGELMRAGATSVEDLMDEEGNPLEMYKTVKLTNSMKLGVQFFEATNTKMARVEVEDIAQAVRGCIEMLIPSGAGAYELMAMCGDCDCFLSRNDGGSVYNLIRKLIDFLDPSPPLPGDPAGG
ncbi:hypothetical protein T484DRAFT_1898098, partial [Baffinella frigidus]